MVLTTGATFILTSAGAKFSVGCITNIVVIGVSSKGHIVPAVRDRPGSKGSDPVAGEAPWRESKTAEPSDKHTRKECAQRTRLQRTVNADVASLHEFPVAETVDNARKQQELAETSPMRQLSTAADHGGT